MSVEYIKPALGGRTKHSFIIGMGLMLLALLIATFVVIFSSDVSTGFPYFFVVPWVFGLGAVLSFPIVYLLARDRFTFYDPLVYATFSYLIPAFFIGGLIFAFGWSQPFFSSFIQDADINLPYTIQLLGLGCVGLAVGYFLSAGRRIGAYISRYLPDNEPEARNFIVPGLLLLAAGMFNSIAATILGIIGYQRVAEIGNFDGLIFLTTLFWAQASFVLWFVVFKSRKFNLTSFIIVTFLVSTSVAKVLYAGNRGGLLQLTIIIGLSYMLSGRQMNFKKSVVAVILVLLTLVAGMIYGTAFRINKVDESKVSIEAYTDNIFSTIDTIGSSDNLASLEFGITNLAERVDVVSSVAVVVSNYEQLQPYEASYGLDNNIKKDLTTFFIPRVIWNDKPVASEPRAYSDLYFNYPDNSFAITPIGDLLRNFGAVGVFVGMLILGVILRVLYRALIEDQPRMLWRSTLYFMLLTSVSYEGFYGSIIPYLMKVGITVALGNVFLVITASRFAKSR